jgi:hypothetical protein
MKPPPIFSGRCISIHSITKQVDGFFAEFGKREHRDFRVAATILDTPLRKGRSPGGRSERVEGSQAGLFELRITPPGRRGPHTRALYICEGPALLIVRGVHKAQRGIRQREIGLADHAALAWRERGDERGGDQAPRGSP